MPNEPNRTLPHELRLDNRSKLSVSGVSEVESFDETTVVLHTARGVLIIRGENLHLSAARSTLYPMKSRRRRAASFAVCSVEWSCRSDCRAVNSFFPSLSAPFTAFITTSCAVFGGICAR